MNRCHLVLSTDIYNVIKSHATAAGMTPSDCIRQYIYRAMLEDGLLTSRPVDPRRGRPAKRKS
jgi:hypothetical protein